MCYGRGRAPGVMGLVALRISKDKKPEKDERFMLPKSRFDDTFEPYNRFGTYVAEMTALDKVALSLRAANKCNLGSGNPNSDRQCP